MVQALKPSTDGVVPSCLHFFLYNSQMVCSWVWSLSCVMFSPHSCETSLYAFAVFLLEYWP